jgi:hypothetical protein
MGCTDDAVQIASELAANAIGHGEPPVELLLDVAPDRVRISVSSVSARDPRPRVATLDDVRGRGLAIVAQLSHDWGWHRAEGRLHVWADLHPK